MSDPNEVTDPRVSLFPTLRAFKNHVYFETHLCLDELCTTEAIVYWRLNVYVQYHQHINLKVSNTYMFFQFGFVSMGMYLLTLKFVAAKN